MTTLASQRGALILAALMVATLFSPALAQAQDADELMEIVRTAEQLVQQQKPDEALAQLQQIFELTDAFAPAYFVAGLAYEAKGQAQEAFDNFVKATEYNPGWGVAHRKASYWAANVPDLDASWEHAIKAHQAGTDMSDAFEGLKTMTEVPDDLDAQLSAARVFVGPVNTETFEEQGDSALQGGSNSAASARTDVGRRVVMETQGDLAQLQQEARQQISDSRAFGLVQRQEQAQLILVFDVDYISDTQRVDDRNRASQTRRRRLRGYVRLLDAQSGEETYSRRIDFRDISSRAEVNRDFTTLMSIMDEWAVEQQR